MLIAMKAAQTFLRNSRVLHGSGAYCSCDGCAKALAEVLDEVTKPMDAELTVLREKVLKLELDLNAANAAAETAEAANRDLQVMAKKLESDLESTRDQVIQAMEKAAA